MSLVTITQTIGCNGLAIARRIAEGLGIELYDDSRLREEAIRMGFHEEKLKGFQEKAPDWFDRILGGKPEMYLELMESVVYEAARRGEGVILGHGSQMLLHDFGCNSWPLKVHCAGMNIALGLWLMADSCWP